MTSIGKCYPGRRPGASVDSPPSRAEVLRWAPYLAEEVRLVAPRLVALVGGLAHRHAFGPDARLDDLVGRELHVGGGTGRIGHCAAASVGGVDLAERPGACRPVAAGDRAPRGSLVGGRGGAMNRETRIGVALVAGLGAFVFLMLVVGSLGDVRPELTEYPVGEILAAAGSGGPARRGRAADRGLVRRAGR